MIIRIHEMIEKDESVRELYYSDSEFRKEIDNITKTAYGGYATVLALLKYVVLLYKRFKSTPPTYPTENS